MLLQPGTNKENSIHTKKSMGQYLYKVGNSIFFDWQSGNKKNCRVVYCGNQYLGCVTQVRLLQPQLTRVFRTFLFSSKMVVFCQTSTLYLRKYIIYHSCLNEIPCQPLNFMNGTEVTLAALGLNTILFGFLLVALYSNLNPVPVLWKSD